MNKFELISENEYNKIATRDFRTKNHILDYLKYDELKIPRRATLGSAGYDFFSPISFKLNPGENIVIPTFIKCRLNYRSVLMILPRSSYGFKYRMQLDNTMGVIDADYFNNENNEGHIFIKITNDSKLSKVLSVNAGDAFAQGIIFNYEVTDDDIALTSVRTGGIGSTSNKNS